MEWREIYSALHFFFVGSGDTIADVARRFNFDTRSFRAALKGMGFQLPVKQSAALPNEILDQLVAEKLTLHPTAGTELPRQIL